MRCLLLVVTLSIVAMGAAADPALWVLLSDNAGASVPRWPTGVTYVYDKAPTNPGDSTGRRLLDGDLPYADWNTCIGHNYEDLTVTFDLRQVCRLGRVRVLMPMPQRPEGLRVSVRAQPDEPWREVGAIDPAGKEDWHELTLPELPPAREVRLQFQVKGWGFYCREAELYGLPDEGSVAQAQGSIVVGSQPGQKSVAAAYDLKAHLEQMTGGTWPLYVGEPPAKGLVLRVGPEAAQAAGVTVRQGDWPTPEEVVLLRRGRVFIVAGNDAGRNRGTGCAATLLLERLGCGWYGPDPLWQVVPKIAKLRWPRLTLRQQPSLAFRQMWYAPEPLSERWLQGGPVYLCGHALDALVPPATYFADHPEYFALIGGKRTATGEWQLCTSNPEVIRLTVEKARQWFDASPDHAVFSLSNNDCGGFCECEVCAKTGANPGARMLTFASAVQSEINRTHPGRQVCFLAYWYTFAAPATGAKAAPGTVVMVVNEACHAHALEDSSCVKNKEWCANFAAWQATGADLAIYEWYIPGCNSPAGQQIPWVPGSVVTRNLRYWQKMGVRAITWESQPAYETTPSAAHPWYPLRWPLFYPAARLTWDTSLSADELLDDACRKLYGPAARPMRQYYALWQQALEASAEHSRAWSLPPATAYLTAAVQARLAAALEEAARKAQRLDPRVGQRVAAEQELFQRACSALAELQQAAAAKP